MAQAEHRRNGSWWVEKVTQSTSEKIMSSQWSIEWSKQITLHLVKESVMLECWGRGRRGVFGEGVRVITGCWCLIREWGEWDAICNQFKTIENYKISYDQKTF